MAIERFQGGTVFTGHDIQNFRLLALKQALGLEVKGIRLPRNVRTMQAAKQMGYTQRTRKAVYAAVCRDVELLLTPTEGEH